MLGGVCADRFFILQTLGGKCPPAIMVKHDSAVKERKGCFLKSRLQHTQSVVFKLLDAVFTKAPPFSDYLYVIALEVTEF